MRCITFSVSNVILANGKRLTALRPNRSFEGKVVCVVGVLKPGHATVFLSKFYRSTRWLGISPHGGDCFGESYPKMPETFRSGNYKNFCPDGG